MTKLGLVGRNVKTFHHGRAPSGNKSDRLALFPSVGKVDCRFLGVLSPVVQQIDPSDKFVWIDYYDDWSLAPDINPVNRALAARSYRKLRDSSELRRNCLVTVNSNYMALKLGLPFDRVVHNGVDPSLGSVDCSGDDSRRLVILGKLFSGRTDPRLLISVASSKSFDEVVLGGVGSCKSNEPIVKELRRRLGSKLIVEDWLGVSELAAIAGCRTVALIPHKVCDYTVSQDLMKVYLMLSLGVRVICPLQLWPTGISREFGFLVGPGGDYSITGEDWLESSAPSAEWRRDFCANNSWHARASQIETLIGAAG